MQKLQHESRWRAGGYALIALVIVFSLAPQAPQIDIEQGDKLGHFLAYGSQMFWFAQIASTSRERLGWALFFVGLGVTLEFVQGALGYRQYDPLDMLANGTGVLLGWLFARALRYAVFSRIELALLKGRPG